MSKKLAAAIAAVATLGLATTASANVSYFDFDERIEEGSVADIGLVRSATDGVVEIYDFSAGVLGDLLGTQDVFAGANGNVRINLNGHASDDVYAILRSGDRVLAEQEFEIN